MKTAWTLLCVFSAVLGVVMPDVMGAEDAVTIEPTGVAPLDSPYPPTPNGGLQREFHNIRIMEYDNGEVSPWAAFFIFDPPDHPKLIELRRKYKLDDIVGNARTDLERAVALKNWVAGVLRFGTPGPEVFSDWSALALLERSERGQRVWCGQAAMVFQQACMAMGMLARFIEVGVPDNPACHFTTEVYLREYGKWAVVDATPLREYNLYYTVDGVPQSALEMHRRVVRNEMDDVTEVHPDREHRAVRRGPAWAFYYVRWLLRCDVVTNTPQFVHMEYVFDRRFTTVEWVDDETVPWEYQQPTFWTRNERLSAWTTSSAEVVNWRPTDRARIVLREATDRSAARQDAVRVNVQLWEADPAFSHFQIRIDDGQWRDLPRLNTPAINDPDFSYGPNFFTVRMERMRGNEIEHVVRARIVRSDGTVGPESFVKFSVISSRNSQGARPGQ